MRDPEWWGRPRLMAALEAFLSGSSLVSISHDGEEFYLEARPRRGPVVRAVAASAPLLLLRVAELTAGRKRCPGKRCGGRDWPLSEFPRDRTRADGYSAHCKLCTRAADRASRRRRQRVARP